jgi:hypothetical protein
MGRKLFSAVIMILALSASGYAAEGDNAASFPAGTAKKPYDAPSFFEGVWGGSWTSHYDRSFKTDFTLTIGKRGEKGGFDVEYSWGMAQLRNRMVPAGSLKTKGRQEGDQFFIKWKNKQGNEMEIKLQKESENKVKGRLDRGGVLPPNESPYYESYLNRK